MMDVEYEVDEAIYQRYLKQKRNREIAKTEGLWNCSKLDCEGLVDEGKRNPMAICCKPVLVANCSVCNLAHCIKCRQPAHTGPCK